MTRRGRRWAGGLIVALIASHAEAQAPVIPAPYRPPTIALVQPVSGGTVPRDRPILVFRGARGDAADPVDAGTFAVAVNGIDRTSHFQIVAEEAWGALGAPAGTDTALALGPHAVTARVCSVRGACGETTASVIAVDPAVPAAAVASAVSSPRSTRARVIELVLDAMRKLFVP